MILDDDQEARERLSLMIEHWMTQEHEEVFRVRELAPSCIIFFMTSRPEYAVEGFAVRALHYCVKPIRPADVAECMGRARERL